MSKAAEVPFATTLLVRDTCLCLHLQRAARALARRFDDALRPLGLTSGQYSTLMSLNRPEPPSIGSVASLLAMDRTTLTRDVKLLEKLDLVEVAPGRDRRTRLVRLTDKGRVAIYHTVPLWEEAQTRMVKGMGKKRWRKLMARLSGVVSLAQED